MFGYRNPCLHAICVLAVLAAGSAHAVVIPAGTVVYGEIEEEVTSRKRDTALGDLVRAHVWRDVVVDGAVVIKAGSPIVVNVSELDRARIVGRKGNLGLSAVSVQGVDGTEVPLIGGYDKSGKGRKALSISLFALVAWPLIFIKGKHARLEPGTIFDSEVRTDVTVQTADVAVPLVESAAAANLNAEVLYDLITSEEQRTLPMRLTVCGQPAGNHSVVAVNGAAIDPIPIQTTASREENGCTESDGTLDLERLAKHFRPGINTFTLSAGALTSEVVLDVEL